MQPVSIWNEVCRRYSLPFCRGSGQKGCLVLGRNQPSSSSTVLRVRPASDARTIQAEPIGNNSSAAATANDITRGVHAGMVRFSKHLVNRL